MAGGQVSAAGLTGNVAIWSWNTGASSLKAVIPGFNAGEPDVAVTMEDLNSDQIFEKVQASCAAGGVGLPDIVSLQGAQAKSIFSQYPDCFVDLRALGYTDEVQSGFPEFKRAELEANGVPYAMPWDTGPVVVFYRRDFYEEAGVDPATIKTWDDFIAAGLKVAEANPGVVMTQGNLNGDSEWFNMIANEQGCGYFSPDGQSISITQPGCVAALDALKSMVDAGVLTAAAWDEKLQSIKAGTVASQVYGGWYEGGIRSAAPEQSGEWGVYEMPSLTADGRHAANLGGSALAIPSASANKEAAYGYLTYALGTNAGQVTMLKEFGLVPSLISALDDPYVSQGQEYWGGQAVWSDILATLPRIVPNTTTAFQNDAESVYRATQTRYLNGEFPDAKTALDDAANQIAGASGLPIAP
ncbi:ABC transporter substrate-binding protein [Devosia sp.]|uniref:extracellular solute-binding protein n=1 Tax=Devosia sp. TaxID=1871048 RepID=UPI0026140DCD|nr:ABC transporter substrate-binding protein [Devosia sp.]